MMFPKPIRRFYFQFNRSFASNSTESKVKIKSRKKKNELHQYFSLNRSIFGPLVKVDKKNKEKNVKNSNDLKQKSPPNYFESSSNINLKSISQADNEDIIIKIDDSKWKDAPENMNITKLLSFPLYTETSKKESFLSPNSEIQRSSVVEKDYHQLPSVTKILQETESPQQKAILEKWKSNMIKKLGKSQFEIYQQNLLHTGSIFHQCLDLSLGQNVDPSPEQLVGIELLWASVTHVLPKFSSVAFSESRVIHPFLHYQGAIDCLATYKNELVLIEFKTSTKPKLTLKSTYDYPLQVVAYLGALMCDENYSLPRIDGALLVIAYPTGLPAHVHKLTEADCQKYWKKWQLRLAQFWKMQTV